MSTQQDTVAFILEKLRRYERFTVRKMFGEYALYADGVVVALVCDDQLYVKIVPESTSLADICEQDVPYPGAKPYYLVKEHQFLTIKDLPKKKRNKNTPIIGAFLLEFISETLPCRVLVIFELLRLRQLCRGCHQSPRDVWRDHHF